MDASKTSISQASSDEAMAEFWDSHDFVDYDTDAPDVAVEVTCRVPIEHELYEAIEAAAGRQGLHVETLVNLWLHEKLIEADLAGAA